MIVSKFPGKFKNFEKHLKENEVIKWCVEYRKQRDWMDLNNIDYFDIPEEKKFINYIKEYKFRQKKHELNEKKSI